MRLVVRFGLRRDTDERLYVLPTSLRNAFPFEVLMDLVVRVS